jgi:hypothetical protein
MILVGNFNHTLERFTSAPAVLCVVLRTNPVNLVATLKALLVRVSFMNEKVPP